VPVHDDRVLFEFLTLEGAQAGLSWSTILKKRPNYKRAFADFDPARVARLTAARERRLLKDPGIVRNRLKVRSTIENARASPASMMTRATAASSRPPYSSTRRNRPTFRSASVRRRSRSRMSMDAWSCAPLTAH
jgi:DNA-3-methyladenine glycosylase I